MLATRLDDAGRMEIPSQRGRISRCTQVASNDPVRGRAPGLRHWNGNVKRSGERLVNRRDIGELRPEGSARGTRQIAGSRNLGYIPEVVRRERLRGHSVHGQVGIYHLTIPTARETHYYAGGREQESEEFCGHGRISAKRCSRNDS